MSETYRAQMELSRLNRSQASEESPVAPLILKAPEHSPHSIWSCCCRRRPAKDRCIALNSPRSPSCPSNGVSNTKYNLVTFIPTVLFNQFRHFFNLFFLCITLSQFYPPLQVGFLFTYVAPLAFVLIVTMIKEAFDDITRWRRDRELNSQLYTKITAKGKISIPSSRIKVGDLIELKENERIPADMVLLASGEESGTVFLRTDQLDGETDWKLRKAVALTQRVYPDGLSDVVGTILVEPPHRNIYSFKGLTDLKAQQQPVSEALSLDNTLWASTVLASSSAIGCVIYTGRETRVALNSSVPASKFGVTDAELNKLAKFLFLLMLGVSLGIVILAGVNKFFFIQVFRYLLLLSYIIPISLRVNLDLAKLYYCVMINKDDLIKGTLARNSNIPEELGRVGILLSDKTGTLTQNAMVFKKCSFEFASIERDDPEHVQMLRDNLLANCGKSDCPMFNVKQRKKKEYDGVVRDLVAALALCHNVTPVRDSEGKGTYQASSPDEVALVKFAESLDYRLIDRKQDFIVLLNPKQTQERYKILEIFPFSSASKRMGIILQHEPSGKILFYLKGAEEVMQYKVLERHKHRILEDCENLARDGLRTLVISQREMQSSEYSAWKRDYDTAQRSMSDRDSQVQAITELLEHDMEYLGVTGVEDTLQDAVPQTIENMQNAGIAVWMLTGDKVETAECIGIATRLKLRDKEYMEFRGMDKAEEIRNRLKMITQRHIPVLDGHTLSAILGDAELEPEFIKSASSATSVICCRVSPTQKSAIAEAVKKYTNLRVCCIGDGGNDVGMIQAAHVGIGIEGKEGKQASLAADFSLPEFRCLNGLLLWHGRLSYKRTSKLSHFIFHRGLLISVVQVLFSCMFYFSTIPIYNGFLMLGYTTIYTTLPVFSIVLDVDATVSSIMKFPNLYRSLQRGRALSLTVFIWWLWKSVYQASVITLLAILLFPDSFLNIVAITFTSLIVTELLNVLTEIERFHRLMGVSQAVTLCVYLLSIFLMKSYFDLNYILSWEFVWKVGLITAASWCPIHIAKVIKNKCDPSDHQKVMEDI